MYFRRLLGSKTCFTSLASLENKKASNYYRLRDSFGLFSKRIPH